MKYEFEKYEKHGARTTAPAVTFSSRTIKFNVVCYELYLKEKDFVELYFDKQSRAVGILSMKKEIPDSFPIKKYRGHSPIIQVNASR